MITHTTDITLDLSCESPRETVYAKQDDNGTRRIKAAFTDNGIEVPLTGVSSAEFRVLRPDGKMVVDTAQISGNAVTAVLTENALATGGKGYGDIRLIDSAGRVISAARFVLHIEKSAVSNQQITGNSDFKKFNDQIDSLTSQLGGLSFVNLPQVGYDHTIHYPNVVYFATDEDGKVTMYLGDVKLTGGTSAVGTADISVNGVTGFAGNAIKENEE